MLSANHLRRCIARVYPPPSFAWPHGLLTAFFSIIDLPHAVIKSSPPVYTSCFASHRPVWVAMKRSSSANSWAWGSYATHFFMSPSWCVPLCLYLPRSRSYSLMSSMPESVFMSLSPCRSWSVLRSLALVIPPTLGHSLSVTLSLSPCVSLSRHSVVVPSVPSGSGIRLH